FLCFFFPRSCAPRRLHSFPTRRSSDLFLAAAGRVVIFAGQALGAGLTPPYYPGLILRQIVYVGYFSLPVVGLTALFTGMVLALQDRKSTRLNSSHGSISYAVFCLKKKN